MKLQLHLLAILIFSIFIAQSQITSIPDTIYPIGMITPDVDVTDPISFPLQNPIVIGDINGDNFTDFAFNVYHVNDERTADLTDYVSKSLIVTDISNPKSGKLLYNSTVSAIGDYNGDGYDDFISFPGNIIYLGNISGNNFDSILMDIPESFNDVLYANDINNDGKSDFLLGEGYYYDSLLVFSQLTETPAVVLSPYNHGNMSDNSMFDYTDYDNDGNKELCIINPFDYESRYIINWHRYNEITGKFDFIENTYRTYSHNPVQSFVKGLIDINGDGYKDISHTYYDDGFQIEYFLANTDTTHYFGESKTVETGNTGRFLYIAGDLNNDGYGDWYSKSSPDTVILYYGNQYLDSTGYNICKVAVDTGSFIYPKSRYALYLIDMPVIFDYNNDDYDDLLFDFWSFDQYKQYDTIGTAIYLGDTVMSFSNPVQISLSKNDAIEEQFFGEKVKNIGDINYDGYEDWAIVAKYASYVNIYFGGSVLDYNPDIQILLPQDSESQCYDIATGDINGDELIDIIASCSSSSSVAYESSMIGNRQNVFIFYGSETLPSTLSILNADIVLDGSETFFGFGMNIAVVGDYNADGYNDFVVGGEKHRDCLREAFVYFGGNSISQTPDMVLSEFCNQCGIYFADPITACGDINNDGFDDFILGDRSTGPGQSLIYFGGHSADSIYDLVIVNPDSTGSYFSDPSPLTSADFTGNNNPDMAMYNYTTQELFIYNGGEFLDNTPDIILTDTSVSGIVSTIKFLKNFSEKNVADIITGRINPLIFFHSSENKTIADIVLKNNLNYYYDIASGDFDNDEHTDIFISNCSLPSYGYNIGGVVQHYRSPIMVTTENIKSSDFTFSISPNPAHQSVNINVKSENIESCNILIYNINGQLIKSSTTETNTPCNLNLAELKTGLYMISVNVADKTYRQKLVVY